MGAFARLQGKVFRSEHRSGARQDGTRWQGQSVHVLVEGAGITEVSLFDDDLAKLGGVQPRVGDSIDWLVEVRQSKYGLNVAVIEDKSLGAAQHSAWVPSTAEFESAEA